MNKLYNIIFHERFKNDVEQLMYNNMFMCEIKKYL